MGMMTSSPLTRFRLERGIKQEELAILCDVQRAVVSYWETGRRTPSFDQLRRICKHYGVSSDYLIGLSDEEEPDISIAQICAYTGLSEKAIVVLHDLAVKEKTL